MVRKLPLLEFFESARVIAGHVDVSFGVLVSLGVLDVVSLKVLVHVLHVVFTGKQLGLVALVRASYVDSAGKNEISGSSGQQLLKTRQKTHATDPT